ERPAPLPPERVPTGLLELPSPFPAQQYLLGATGWQQDAGGDRLTVYVGALGSDRRQGVLVVVTTSAAMDERTVEIYRAPVRGGSLRLVAAQDGVLVLRDEGGRELSF